MRVGIPRALLYYEDYPFWQHLLTTLGLEVVLSPRTHKGIVDQGVRLALDEACLPVKICYGHLAAFRAMDVDVILLPRYVSQEKRTYLCPKLMGLPDMVVSIPGVPRLLKPCVDFTKSGLDGLAKELARELGLAHKLVAQAAREATAYQEEVRIFLRKQGITPDLAFDTEAPIAALPSAPTLKIGVLGHPYNLYDAYLNMDLLKRLRRWGIAVITPELLEPEAIAKAASKLPKRLFWSLGERIVGAALLLMQNENVAGMLHLAAFGCGLDSIVGEIIARRAGRLGRIPLMTINIDEHTGQAGLITRLEAFVDMLRRRHSLAEERRLPIAKGEWG